MTRLVRMAALGVLAALALAACGDEGGIAAPQKEQAQKADAICREVQSKVGRLGDDPAMERDAVRSAAERLRAMNPPSENETVWMRFVTDTENLWLSLEDVAQARDPSTNDRARAERALQRVRDTNNRIKELAKDYGMQDCARSGFEQA